MNSQRASRVAWCGRLLLLLFAVAGSVASCVAQEPYRPPEKAAGAAGKSSGAGGSLSLPGAGATGAESAGGDPEPAGSPGCRTSDQCAPPYPYCLATEGLCVECLSLQNCRGSAGSVGRPFCDLKSHSCVGCLSEAQCTKTTPYCAAGIGECVECTSTTNCGRAGIVCDSINYRCVPGCDSNADCAATALTPVCDPERSLCVECATDAQCSTGTPRCDPASKTCVACAADEDCAADTPRCDAHGHVCVQCVSVTDCRSGATCVGGVCVDPR